MNKNEKRLVEISKSLEIAINIMHSASTTYDVVEERHPPFATDFSISISKLEKIKDEINGLIDGDGQ